MSTELRLYFFDPRPDEAQAGREAALHDIFDNSEYWHVTDWGKENVKPHFYLTAHLQKPLDVDSHLTPAISYVVEKLVKSDVPPEISKAVGAIILQMHLLQKKGRVLSVSITLPDHEAIYCSEGENASIEIPFKLIVRQDATSDQIAIT